MGSVFNDFPIDVFIFYIGCGLALYVYFYLTTELGIRRKKYTILQIAIVLIVIELFRETALHFMSYHQAPLIDLACSILQTMVSFAVSFQSVRLAFQSNNKNRNPFFLASIATFCLAAILPLLILCVEKLYWESLFMNLGFLIISAAYFKHYFAQMKFENEIVHKNQEYLALTLNERYIRVPNILADVDLTPREREIGSFLLGGLTYKEIALKLFLSEATVRKHASHLYSKTGVYGNKKLKHFREKFKNFPQKESNKTR